MKNATRSKVLCSLALIFTGGCISINAQTIFFNNGAMVFTGATSIVKVNGGFQNDGAAGTTPVFENNGTMTIASSGTPGSVFLTNGSTLQGNGTIFVEQDWTNDATFTAMASTVNFNGNTQQFITSTIGTVTTFNNLTLTGSGAGANRKKTLQAVNAIVGPNGILTINNRELETQTNTMFVLNTAVAAVTNTTTFGSEGFVSSNVGGSLSRATNSAAVYLFPTGSSAGILRYRPIELTPGSASPNVFTGRLGNNTATIDGFDVLSFDTSMCRVTSLFYHQINRSAGTDNAGIDVFYDQAADGPWDGLAQWNTPTAALWNNMGTVVQTVTAGFNDVLKAGWADFSNSPYILSRAKLADPVFACNDVCENSTGNIFTASGAPAGADYTWTTPAGTSITSGQTTPSITVSWGTTPGPVSVTSTNSVGCFSDTVFCTVNVATPPTALFDTTSTGFTYTFTDMSTNGATSWNWDFGDGTTSSSQNPSHVFTSNGIKTVCLEATNSTGCTDTTCFDINLDVTEFINIPNVFSPDGDGVNDQFYIANNSLEDFKIEIFNRWGVKVFESEAPNVKWDGRTTAGVEVTDGTYFYILKAKTVTSKDYSQTGFISLVRSK
ncbi:MAG: gliding motility-associated C-terminal domain-containing protein [Bacteroidota bacterium]|nr:gliding motility-associated C-terminal domain-containing protein [Bacteroidota bacterium]